MRYEDTENDIPIKTKSASKDFLDNWARNFGPMYYAHSTTLYGTDEEKQDVELLTARFEDVLNPNTPEHTAGYLERRERTGAGMDYFTEEVLPKCRGCVIRAFADGMIGAGVYAEAMWFVTHSLPVYELKDGQLVSAVLPLKRELSVEATKARVKAGER